MNSKDKARGALYKVINHLNGDKPDRLETNKLLRDTIEQLTMCAREEFDDQTSSTQQLAKKEGIVAQALSTVLQVSVDMKIPDVEPELDEMAQNLADAARQHVTQSDEPAADEPTQGAPAADEPAASDQPATDEPATDKPADEPAQDTSAASEPAADEPATEPSNVENNDEWAEDMSPPWDGDVEKSLGIGKKEDEEQDILETE